MCFFLPVVHVFLDGCQDGFGSCAVFVSLDNGTLIWCHLTWGKHCTFSRVSIAPCSFGQRGIFLMSNSGCVEIHSRGTQAGQICFSRFAPRGGNVGMVQDGTYSS